MLIHKGKKYSITAKGGIATKTDGMTSRTMTFYPERDAAALAGEIDEATAWRLLLDIATQVKRLHCDEQTPPSPISPQHILIDGAGFTLSEWSADTDPRFSAPEGYNEVWALGASLFQIFLGCHVFQGKGGAGQTPTAPVPTLRRELPDLSRLVASMLSYKKSMRPSLDEIIAVASANLQRSDNRQGELPPKKKVADGILNVETQDSFWPEDLY